MEIRPIVSALSRHKIAATLIVLEMALTCAIICNAVFLIASRVERIREPSGVAESEIVRVQVVSARGMNATVTDDTESKARTEEDLAALRAIPGVRYAAIINQLPLAYSSWNTGIYLEPDQNQSSLVATLYMGSPQLLETLGVRLTSGRGFRPDEYIDFRAGPSGGVDPPSVIITQAMAQQLFPGGNALGKTLYSGGQKGSQVVGIVDTLVPPTERNVAFQSAPYSAILPLKISYEVGGNYVMRVSDPARRAGVLQAAEAVLRRADPNRMVIETGTFEDIRAFYYRDDRAMAWLLAIVCVALLAVTAFGIVGLASFWVAQRTHQIGVRRALGGTRAQILAYFQIENLLLTTLGIALGMVLAFGINQLLMSSYELPRLPLVYLPVGAGLLWILGQLAALGPALRAADVPPAVATRSV